MNRKISLLIAALCTQGLVEQAQANHCPQKTVQFYAGLSGGVEQLKGRQSDSLLSPVQGESRVFTTNRAFPSANNGVAVTGMTGVMWNIPNIPFSIGPEVYIGRGDETSTFRFVYNEPLAGEDRVYTSTVTRKSFYGILLRAGYNFSKEYLAYITVGADMGNFSTKRAFTKDGGIPDTNTSTVRSKKQVSGTLFGIGFEKQMGSFKVSLDMKGIHYGKKSFSDLIPTTNGVNGATSLEYSVQPKIYSGSIGFAYLF